MWIIVSGETTKRYTGQCNFYKNETGKGCKFTHFVARHFFQQISDSGVCKIVEGLIVLGTDPCSDGIHWLKERMTSEDNKSDKRAVAFFWNSSGSFLREKHFLPLTELGGSNSSKRRNAAERFNIRQVFLGGISWKYPRSQYASRSSVRPHSFARSLFVPGEFISPNLKNEKEE